MTHSLATHGGLFSTAAELETRTPTIEQAKRIAQAIFVAKGMDASKEKIRAVAVAIIKSPRTAADILGVSEALITKTISYVF